MSSYQYETHLHTSEVSACSVAPAVELVHFYKKLGYAGIFVTDHFVAQVPPLHRRDRGLSTSKVSAMDMKSPHARVVKSGLMFFWGGNIAMVGHTSSPTVWTRLGCLLTPIWGIGIG